MALHVASLKVVDDLVLEVSYYHKLIRLYALFLQPLVAQYNQLTSSILFYDLQTSKLDSPILFALSMDIRTGVYKNLFESCKTRLPNGTIKTSYFLIIRNPIEWSYLANIFIVSHQNLTHTWKI